MFLFPEKYVRGGVVFSLLTVGLFAALSWFADIKKDVVLHTISSQLFTTHASLTDVADLSNRNQVDELTERIIKDCDRREAYEHTLSRLAAGLSVSEMREALGLYESCGDYFALRKRIMLMKMEMLFNQLSVLEQMYQEYSGSMAYEKTVATWKEILSAETKRTALLSEQTVLQGEIIKALSSNPRADLKDKLARAEDIGQQLEVQYAQIETLRKGESSIWGTIMSRE